MIFIFLEGAKRSGNHLFVDWLAAQAGALAHCNNYFYRVDEDVDAPRPEPDAVTFETSLASAMTYLARSGRPVSVISFEYPGRLSPDHVNRIFDAAARHLKPAAAWHQHILRDPFNWMASYARMKASAKIHGIDTDERASFEQTRDNFAVFHRQYWDRWLRAYRLWAGSPESTRIDYNRFVVHAEYRRALATRFAQSFDDAADAESLRAMSGPGSSFQDDGRNLATNVRERYEYALPLFESFPPPPAVWQAASLVFPTVTRAVRERLAPRRRGVSA